MKFRDGGECFVIVGRWIDPFTGSEVTDPSQIDIDHMVPLSNAHRSGGWAWDAARKEAFANHLDYPGHLIAVTASANRSKGDKGPHEWKPPAEGYWCDYAIDWIRVKAAWQLVAIEEEWTALLEMLGACTVEIVFDDGDVAVITLTPTPVSVGTQTVDCVDINTASPEDLGRIVHIVDHYLTTCRTEGKTPKTIAGYKDKLARLVRWLDGTLGDFHIESVRRFTAELQSTRKWQGHPYTPEANQFLSPTTVADYVRVLKGFATWLFEEGYTTDNLLSRLAVPKAPQKVIQVLSEDEVTRLLSAINAHTANGCRDLAMVVLLLDTGLRCAELISLKHADVHLEEQWLKVMGKGQKERFVPFGVRVSKLLGRYITFFRPAGCSCSALVLTRYDEPINQNTLKMLFCRLQQKTGIERLHPHLLRHTFATSYLVAGGDVFTLQTILGHTTLEMTRRYIALASTHVNVQHRRFSPMDRMNVPSLRAGAGRSNRLEAREPERMRRDGVIPPRISGLYR